jgi:hypothetical protein
MLQQPFQSIRIDPWITQINVKKTAAMDCAQYVAQSSMRMCALRESAEVKQFGIRGKGGNSGQTGMNMIISLVGKNIKPVALRIELHFYRTGRMSGIELHSVARQAGAFQRLQNAAARIVLPDAGDQNRLATESRQVVRHIERRTPQNLAVRKPVYENFAEQEYGVAGDSHRLPLEENLFVKRKKETSYSREQGNDNLSEQVVMYDSVHNLPPICKTSRVKTSNKKDRFQSVHRFRSSRHGGGRKNRQEPA